jgi:hypothetical protein
MAIAFGIAISGIFNGLMPGIIIFCLGLFFIYLMVVQSNGWNVLMGILLMIYSIYMSLAFLSDMVKLDEFRSTRSIGFLIGGAVFISLNFLMSGKLIYRALDKTFFKNRSSAPHAA